jgi:hypothetical protein
MALVLRIIVSHVDVSILTLLLVFSEEIKNLGSQVSFFMLRTRKRALEGELLCLSWSKKLPRLFMTSIHSNLLAGGQLSNGHNFGCCILIF